MKNISLEFSKFSSVNHLWSDLIENYGFERAKKLISQANDLQKMNGLCNITMPMVFTSTGGIALISIDLLEKNSCFKKKSGNKVLIFNPKRKTFQILYETN